MSSYVCGTCGDAYQTPPEHDCWLARKMSNQETLPTEHHEWLEFGHAPDDEKLSVLVRQVDISNL